MRIKTGDTVKVLYGKDAGKIAAVLAVNPKKDMIVVDGVNMFKKHIKGDGQTKKSEIVNIVKPVPVSKVMIVCPNCSKATRIGAQEGERICKKCGKSLDKKVESKAKKEDKK